MDRGGDELIGWSIDGLAAALLGVAVGACFLLLGLAGFAVSVGPVAGMAALAGLRQVRPEPRRFRMPTFSLGEGGASLAEDDLSPMRVSDGSARLSDILLLKDRLDAASPLTSSEPLELEDRLPEPSEDSRVVRLFAAHPLPTPGELAKRIDHHLEQAGDRRGDNVLELEVDAAAALRQALGELRRNLG